MMSTPGVGELSQVMAVLREWQHDRASMQLHPGDLGWFWRFGAPATAAAVRAWSRDGHLLAIGLLDGPRLVRLAIAPDAQRDDELARRLVDDLADPARGVRPAGRVDVESPPGARIRELLAERGWDTDEPWTQLARNLTEPVPTPGLRIEVAGPDRSELRAELQRASFEGSTFTEDRWHAMAAGPTYADARCLIGYDDRGDAVAVVTVWSAGHGRPGLLEPMGVHRDHRGRGHGTAITLAGAVALRDLGSSSALVAAPSANVGAVATYTKAGFRRLGETRDHCRT